MKKKFAVLLCAGLLALSLASCAGSQTGAAPQTTSPSASASASATQPPSPSASASSETFIIGKVTAVKGSQVTLALSSKNGQPAQAPAPEPSAAPKPPQPSSPSPAQPPPAPPDATSSATKKAAPMAFTKAAGTQNRSTAISATPAGNTITITVSPSTVVTVDSAGKATPGSISDIAVGDLVVITMSGDTVKAVTVGRFETATPSGGQNSAPAPSGGQYGQNGEHEGDEESDD